jgi:hypothetical protein
MRRAGFDFDAIAEAVGYASRSGAWKAVVKLLEARARETSGDTDHVLAVELERLDAMLRALWPAAAQGDFASIDRVIKIMDQRARFLGLYAPTRAEHSGPNGGAVKMDFSTMSIEDLERIARGSSDVDKRRG